MKTTDFSGSYDYEKEEALAVAEDMLSDLADGYYDEQQFAAAVLKTSNHWKKVLPSIESYNDFALHFNNAIIHTGAGMILELES
jgi:hypothetical protein